MTKNLVNMAFVHLVKRVHLEKRDPPQADLDLLFIVTSLQDFFAEHDVIARTLEGEKVGAWFDDMQPRVDRSPKQARSLRRNILALT